MNLCVFFVCLCIISAVHGSGNSLKDPYICGPPSCAASEKFKYLAQTVYYYNYNVNVETYFAGSSNNRSTLDVTAEVKVQFITPCEGLLQLQKITLTDQDENYAVERSEKFIQAVSQFDLRFAFHDGVISEICPNLLEEDWVLNFKRAILSLFQNSMKRFDINFNGFEQDIHGTCNVEYTVRGQENTSLILVKKRDLALCTDRYKYMSILQTVRYDFQSKFQTWPVLKSESKCRISIDHNIYKSVNCRERHLFEPFSGRNSGAMSTVIQDLVLIKELNRTDIEIMESQPKAWSVIQKRSNILHHHVPNNRGDTGELRSARDVLKMLCLVKETGEAASSVDENMDSGSVVGLWGRLVRAARSLHHPALAQLLARAPAICPAAAKHILDALPYIASAGSVELIKDKVIHEDVDKETRHEWLMSMAMIPRPRIEMLKSMLELLQKEKNDKIVSFTVSSMLHSYCRHSGKSLQECCEEEIPKQILEEFQNIVMEVIGKGLQNATRNDRNKMTYAIKSLGNIGGFKSEFADVLLNVIGDAMLPVPLRLVAIDAFRRTPCTETREYFLETFREELVDIEVRIASYLQVMRCPDLSIIRRVLHALKNEPVNQAVTFVWSHLKNVGQSSLPSRVEVQGLLSGHAVPRLADTPDFRVYSRNYEQSVFFDQYNAGGNYEANVVFSPDSYIPRSVSLNLTVDMFGESINLLEIKARGEGFEKYFEAFFGKNGPWSKEEVTSKINKLRIMRSTNEADELKEKVDGLGYKNNALKHRYPMAELGLKVFGNEISFWSAEGPDEIVKSLEKLNPKLRVLEILSGKEIKYNKASLFLDTTFSVPTGCGLPLNMNLMGTSYVDTKMSGTVVDRFQQAGNLDFAGMIRPSQIPDRVELRSVVMVVVMFPNMTNLHNAPYFLMSGPAKYILSLEKADPSAKTYAFQYKWQKNDTTNVIGFSFDTPDSKEKRMIDASMVISNTSTSASLSLQSARSTLAAHALCRNLPHDKSLQARLDVDGRKQFDTTMSVTRHDIKHGHVWIPHAYWVVNNETIAELSGTVKVKTKGGVTQWDITTDFQTRQLASRLIGYYTLNGPTHGAKLQLDYEFYRNPKQSIRLEGVYSERVLGYRHDLYGELSMDFTAYPGYNFYAVLRNVKTQSHIDIGFNVSASRQQKLEPAFTATFKRIDKLSGVKLAAELAITRPPRPILLKFNFEETGPKYSALAVLNFNPKSREIVLSGYVFAPAGSQLYVDAEANITLPTLHPCTLRAKLHEKQPNEFQLNAVGIWFTGVDFNVDALYQDQSKTNLASHRVKLTLNSSHFKDILLDARFTQDNRQITFIGQGEYNTASYRALVRHVSVAEQRFSTYGEVDAAGRAYSLSLNADLNNNTDVSAHLHFDQLRDVEISYQRSSTDLQKRLSASINWDANRDPSQKLSVDVQLDSKGRWHRAGHLALYYPGRVVNGEFEFLLKDWFCEWHVRMGWASDATVLWRVKMYSEAHEETVYALLSSLDTPFSGWRDTAFNVMWRYQDNLQAINGSMKWQEDYLAFSLLADYLFKANEFYGELSALVNSTIPTLPRAAAIARHRAVWKKSADTLLSFQYNDEGKLMINSSWNLERGEKENNITGRVTLVTPFQGYTSGFLRTEFVIGHKRDIKGITYLDLEEKVVKIYVDGHMRRITNCMLVVNVSSPASEQSRMTARFGFVERDRHLVALVVTPNSTTGVEVLLQLQSLQQFQVLGHVALPLHYLSRALLTARRAPQQLDFRVGWSDMDFGFTGIWQWKSALDFVYVYKLYTPLDGFEENGLVLKNVFGVNTGGGLDTELSMRLSKHKFGIAILLVDKGKGLLDVIKDRFQHKPSDPDMFVENFDTTANVVLDTLYYPTITFHGHMMKFVGPDEEDILEANATLYLPNKTPIILTDIFVLETYTEMRNTLNLVTPFQAIKELKSVYTVDITLGEKFNVTCVALLYNGTYWHEISYKILYEYECGEDDAYQSYLGSVGIATPLAVLPGLEARVSARLEDALWKMAADISMPSFTINALARLELDDPFIETSGSLNMTSTYLEDYFIKMEFKKDFSDVESVMGGGIQIQQGDYNNYLFADAVWRPAPRHVRFKARGALVPVLEPSDIALQYSEEGGQRTLIVDFNNQDSYYSLKADQRPASLSVALSSPHKGFRAMKIITEFEKDDIRGSLVTDATEYAISGKVTNRQPLEMSLVLIPKGQGDQIRVRMKLEATHTVYALTAHVAAGGQASVQASLHARAEMETNFTDIYLKVDIPQVQGKEILLKTRVDMFPGLRRVLSVQAATPLKKLSFVKGDTDFEFGPKTGYLLCKYELPDMKGDGDLKWSFLIGDLYITAIGHQLVKQLQRSVDLDIFFGNSTSSSGLDKTEAGFRMDLDKVWQIGGNASFGYIMNKRINLVINAILPKPNVDVHTLYIDGDIGTEESPEKVLLAEYRTDVTKIVTGIKGKVLNLGESLDANATLTWTSNSEYKNIDNELSYKWDVNGSKHVEYTLTSPLYKEPTFNIKGSYQQDMIHNYQVLKCLWAAACFAILPNSSGYLLINNLEEKSDNKVDLFWPNKTATVNTSHIYTKQNNGFTQTGIISLSVPLNSQHLVNTEYYYVQGDKNSNGNATIDFDHERFVKGSFVQVLSKSERNLDLATTDIEVENVHTPVGVKYIHEFDDTGNVDVKQATVFHLQNATKFNVTGKLDVLTYDIGKKLKLTAMHGQRTWSFDNKYETIERELTQASRVQWADDVWIQYDVHVTNMSVEDTESQQVLLNVQYPLRTFSVDAVYRLQEALLEGRAQLQWDVRGENKSAELNARWDTPPADAESDTAVHNVHLALSHPSFRKDVLLKGQYLATPAVMSNITLELQYSDYETEYLKLHSILMDNSNGPIRDYKFALTCTHPSTNLALDVKSDVNIHSRWYYLETFYKFQKSLFYEKLRRNKMLIDLNTSAVNWERANETYFYKVNGTWELIYPAYKLRGLVIHPDGNDTAFAELSMIDKSLVGHYNSTNDISYHLIGKIVDTRSAKLNAWRNFDDVTTVDLASYIRLNHSRLLTSSVVWRPQIFSEVKSQAVYTLKLLYAQINETLMIIKEAPMEAHLALRAIWIDAKPRIRDFLDDLNDLHVIKDDLDEFERFLNDSYDSNDFYVKDIVEFTYYVLDEMAIRNHLESLPGFVNDMWGMMGNTSQSIKQSLTYVVDSIKTAYSNFLESANKVLEADFMELVSGKLETMILQYDNFVRDLHMRFLEYWEVTWVNATNRLSVYWHDLLKSIEPLFFKVLHYTESFVFTIWKSLMDFFYNRTQELTDSPYFNYVSTFGHEMDRIYKDLVHNDLITNIKKYSKKLWNVVWEKMEKYIPFKDEFKQLYAEFRNAWENFMKTPQVVYVREKVNIILRYYFFYNIRWQTSKRPSEVLYAKLTDIAHTALRYEELHRIPKTNFVFDPRAGEIRLEQKLPMSWHAFNRTPDFTEIAEYRAVRDFLDDWITSNRTIWSYYYEIRPYMDLNNVMPPFAGMAMMTGQGTLVTFDKQVLTISEAGTFLLTKDYRQNNFTVLMQSNARGQYDLVVLTDKHLIYVDLYTEQVSLGPDTPLSLPAVVDDFIVHRQTDLLTVEGQSGLEIQCNLLFRTCKLQVSGWHYASLGGLLGTYNNEQYDEQQLPDGILRADVAQLAAAWRLRPAPAPAAVLRARHADNDTQCDKFFRNKVSPLHPCFSVIDSQPLYAECVRGADACALASAYLELCAQQHVPTHIPDHCVQCTTSQGDVVEEGSFVQLDHPPNSTDVVFVIEAQYCNKNLRKAKNIDLFIEAFDSKLQGNGFSDNRYAVVVYGGSGVYREPRALYVDNQLFADAVDVPRHFDAFHIDKTDSVRNESCARVDTFAALRFASALPLRAATPRALLLLPCDRCDVNAMALDYSTIYHNLMENSVTLHIIMNDEFTLSKKRVAKYLFGVDSTLAYTNKDYERVAGDAALRKQVKLPKDKLGVCISLAMETNGTVWAGAKLTGERGAARRFATVVGSRVARAGRACASARCECRAARLHCRPCRPDRDPLELSFWNTEDIDELIDLAMDPPNLPSFR
ncbi:PREDICTED: uncharacterized protein LOC106103192 [Papilio polytes]|uniref:uncharacterized protein LOC106103192 n=1 Tax=Papilio polytes TaxID=76194 RepID=UPI00067632B9|nr:PREDICTED: uncharacterized protein LOC106103192 [Papilio polytes]